GIGQGPGRLARDAELVLTIPPDNVHGIGIKVDDRIGPHRLADEIVIELRRDEGRRLVIEILLGALEGIAFSRGIRTTEEALGIDLVLQPALGAQVIVAQIILVSGVLETEPGPPVIIDVEQTLALDMAAEGILMDTIAGIARPVLDGHRATQLEGTVIHPFAI